MMLSRATARGLAFIWLERRRGRPGQSIHGEAERQILSTRRQRAWASAASDGSVFVMLADADQRADRAAGVASA
jgi:hypothetical protein